MAKKTIQQYEADRGLRQDRLSAMKDAATLAMQYRALKQKDQELENEKLVAPFKNMASLNAAVQNGMMTQAEANERMKLMFQGMGTSSVAPAVVPQGASPLSAPPNFISQGGQVIRNPLAVEPIRMPNMQSQSLAPDQLAAQYGLSGRDTMALRSTAAENQLNMQSEQQRQEALIPIKAQEKEALAKVDLEATAPKMKSLYQDFNDAVTEIKTKSPEALKTGFEGFIGRQGLKIGSSKFIDEYPKVAALADNIKADATAFAKAAGEQRPTDVDIERFLTILLDPRERSLETNISKAYAQKRRLDNQSINTDWMEPLIAQMEETQKSIGWEEVGNGVRIREIK